MVTFLWAQDGRGVIGKDEHLPWHLHDDLQYFKAQTVGKLMIVGRRTYEGFPQKPLPDRTNLVLTRQPDFKASGAIVVHSVDEALAYAQAHTDQEVVVAGGAEIFEAFLPVVDTLRVTRIDGEFEGDTYMVPIDYDQFELIESTPVSDEDPRLSHTFEVWHKKR